MVVASALSAGRLPVGLRCEPVDQVVYARFGRWNCFLHFFTGTAIVSF